MILNMALFELLLVTVLATMGGVAMTSGGVAMTSLRAHRSARVERASGDVARAKNVEALKSYFKCPTCQPDLCPPLHDR